VRKVRLIATADWHLCETPPKCRSGHNKSIEDWGRIQRDYLRQVAQIAKDNGEVPIVCAGDIFDRYNPSPELINLALDDMPHVFAVAGNHELPHHRLDRIYSSAFWTLKEAGKLTLLNTMNPRVFHGFRLWGYSWGQEPVPLAIGSDLLQEICVCHKYLHTKTTGYHGAPEESRIANCAEQFAGHDVVISGDNHIPFNVVKNGIRFLNCGSLYRRTSDQEDYRPAVWKIYDDNSVEPVYLDISKDVFQRTEKKEKVTVGSERQEEINEFIQAIGVIKGETVDFDEAIRRTIRKGDISDGAKEMLIRYLEETQK
jgi:DNA repair exonuclease SbcCD nuclease subunit